MRRSWLATISSMDVNMNGNQFRLLISDVIVALETSSCEDWSLVRSDDSLATIKTPSMEMTIRLYTVSKWNKIEFAGVYVFPGTYSATIHNLGPKQTMRIDRATPSLIAFKILTRFFPAYTSHVRNYVARCRRLLNSDVEVVQELLDQIDLASSGRLHSSEDLVNSWTPDGPFVFNLEGRTSEKVVVSLVFDRSSQIDDAGPSRFTYSVTASDPKDQTVVEEVLLGYNEFIAA